MWHYRGAVAGLVLLAAAGCATTTGQASKPHTITVTSLVTVTVTADLAPGSTAAVTIDGVKHIDACDLLNQKEASQLADLELQKGVGSGEDHGLFTLCTYTRDPNLSGNGQVSLLAGDGAEKAFHVDKDSLQHPFTRLKNIGDEAWQEDGAIFLRVGTNWAAVELFLLVDPKLTEKRLQQAATIAAGRM